MNADYFRVYTRIWLHASAHKWDDATTCLALYLLTCRHRNLEGLYVLPKLYVCDDLRWTPEHLEAPWGRLLQEGFIEYDDDLKIVFVRLALKYQQPEHMDQMRAGLRVLAQLPKTPLLDSFLAAADEYCPEFARLVRAHAGREWAGLKTWLKQQQQSESMDQSLDRIIYRDRDLVRQARVRDGSTCRYCGKKVNWSDRRGPDGGTYDIPDPAATDLRQDLRGSVSGSVPKHRSNLGPVVCCRACRIRKNGRGLAEAGMRLLPVGNGFTDQTQIGPEDHSGDTQVARENTQTSLALAPSQDGKEGTSSPQTPTQSADLRIAQVGSGRNGHKPVSPPKTSPANTDAALDQRRRKHTAIDDMPSRELAKMAYDTLIEGGVSAEALKADNYFKKAVTVFYNMMYKDHISYQKIRAALSVAGQPEYAARWRNHVLRRQFGTLLGLHDGVVNTSGKAANQLDFSTIPGIRKG